MARGALQVSSTEVHNIVDVANGLIATFFLRVFEWAPHVIHSHICRPGSVCNRTLSSISTKVHLLLNCTRNSSWPYCLGLALGFPFGFIIWFGLPDLYVIRFSPSLNKIFLQEQRVRPQSLSEQSLKIPSSLVWLTATIARMQQSIAEPRLIGGWEGGGVGWGEAYSMGEQTAEQLREKTRACTAVYS